METKTIIFGVLFISFFLLCVLGLSCYLFLSFLGWFARNLHLYFGRFLLHMTLANLNRLSMLNFQFERNIYENAKNASVITTQCN